MRRPTGYVLARKVHSLGVACQVIAASLIPRPLGTRSKPTVETPAG
jgi:hypothetical protein